MAISTHKSLTNYLEILKPEISSYLISPQCWDNIETVASILPRAITTFFGFECRLGVEEAHADFLICADAKEVGRKILAEDQYSIALPNELYTHSVWQQIRNFSEQWNNKNSPLYDGVNNIWLEFDIDKTSNIDESLATIPVPSCFFGPQPIYSNSDSLWTVNDALKLLKSQDVPQEIAAKLLNCYQLLPENAYVFQVGVMLARRSDLVRICIRNISPEQILNYLTNLNWSGSIDHLKQTLDKLSNYAARIDLDIDIGESVLPKIGLECYLEKQPQYEPKWQLFLDYLVETGFCTSQKRDSLLTYTGYVRGKQRLEFLPNNLERISSFLDSNCEGVFFKGLHHIKMTYQEDKPLEAKAYLYVDQKLITPKLIDNYKAYTKSELLAT